MLTADPNLVFNTGAWLSFLAVAALGRVAGLAVSVDADREAPMDAITATDRIRQLAAGGGKWLLLRYKQTLFVLVATTPLVAAAFHVLSPVGLAVNVLLIPVVVLCLWAGFVTLFVGIFLPPVAFIPAAIFSWSLGGLLAAVEWSATVPGGHVYVPDLPIWFVPTYYLLLVIVLFVRSPAMTRLFRTALLVCVAVSFILCGTPKTPDGMRVTVLDIGHGSAAVIELKSHVFLVDAGALSRSDRSTELVCRFLWNRGHRKLNGILISHADLDHYNAVPGIFERMPVAEIITSQDFLHSDAPSVKSIIQTAKQKRIPVSLAFDGDSCRVDGAEIRVLQADTDDLPGTASDNEKSLVVSLRYAGRHLILPGDIEGAGLHQLLDRLAPADLLVSPHHGSTNSNTTELAATVQPAVVAASSRNSTSRSSLENVFAASDAVHYTCEVGAITATIKPDGDFSTSMFRTPAR